MAIPALRQYSSTKPKVAPTETNSAPQPKLTPPHDFAVFWGDTVAELDGVALDIDSEPFKYEPYPHLRGRNLRFSSLGNARIRGYAIGWRDNRPRPLVVHAHGYGGRVAVQWLWARSGLNVVGLDVRGFGRSFDAVPERSPWGYMLTGIEEPRRHVLRGAVCDYIRAYQVGAEFFGHCTNRTIFRGFSFSGALALMSEAVTKTATLLAIGVPTFGWHEGRLRLVETGSAVEVRLYLENRPAERDPVLQTLGYFDSMNFAPMIECPTLAGYGRKDVVVPPETVKAILRHLHCRRETMSMPMSHTDDPAEAAWELFDAAWIEMAQYGVPRSFGTQATVHRL